MGIPRGIQNFNPGNIRRSDVRWQGEVEGTDKAFETFATMHDGLRALAKLLVNYQLRHGLDCVARVIARFAPESDSNPTASYAEFVARQMGVSLTERISLTDPARLASMVRAIVRFEQGGNWVTAEQIGAAVTAALDGVDRPAVREA